MMDLKDFNMGIQDIVDSLDRVIRASNPHLKGRLILKMETEEGSSTFKVMKRIRATVYYYVPEIKRKTDVLTVQEIMRMPESVKETVMEEFAKMFLVTSFMWTSSQTYNDLISGKFDIQQSSN